MPQNKKRKKYKKVLAFLCFPIYTFPVMRTTFYIYNEENKLVSVLAHNSIGRTVAELEVEAHAIAKQHNGRVEIVRK